MATIVDTDVAHSDEKTISVGFIEPAAASKAIAVVGISWIDEVLIASKVHIACVAITGLGLRPCKLSIALIPKGVAALLSPSMLAVILRDIWPIAGWSLGTSGNSLMSSGVDAFAILSTMPAACAI